ncbi:CfaE/CblD family pilus tip adhesin [Pseudomonas kitaguniensis]|uniref:CfaE/CblD family pilus tip adhesin n=1 Tax=Pseudomonas kitaguniensis TaxID=2607908 RepID=UPI003D01A219
MRKSLYIFKIFLTTALLSYNLNCQAAISPPIVPITNKTKSVTFNIDKGTASKDLTIWDKESGGEGSITPTTQDDSNYYSRMSWLCQSKTSEITGACDNTPQFTYGPSTPISLQFIEKKTQIKKTIQLTGRNFIYSRTKPSSVWQPMNAVQGGTWLDWMDGKKLSVFIPSSEIKKLPIGGSWEAKLILKQSSWDPTYQVATWTANINVNLVDSGNAQIYLPDYNTATPTIDLDLRRTRSSLSGNVTVQACLYDGFNAQSDTYAINMSDPNSKDGKFYINNLNPSKTSNLKTKISYKVFTSTIAAPSVISSERTSGSSFIFSGVSQMTPRLTSLPNIPNPVYCSPWQFSLRVLESQPEKLENGNYSGVLRIKFSPSTSNR